MNNILIISSSPRKKGNSQILCEQFQKGALDKGHHVTLIRLMDLNIGFCTHRRACLNNGFNGLEGHDEVVQRQA